MVLVLENAGRAFIKAALPALLIVAIGVSQQPTLHGAVLVGIAGIMGALAAGLAALQTYVPQITVRFWIGDPAGGYADAFLHGFLGAFITALIGILKEPSLSGWYALLIGALVGALNAGAHAVEGLLSPAPRPAPIKTAPNVTALRRPTTAV